MNKQTSWSADAGVGDYLDIMRRQRTTILVTFALVIALVVALTLRADKVYESTSTVLLERSEADGAAAAAPVYNALEVLSSRTMANRVNEALGADAELIDDTSFAIVGESDVVSISVRSSSPTVAQSAADAYSAAFVAWRTEAATAANERALAEADSRVESLLAEIGRINTTIAGLEAAGAIVDGEPLTGEASAALSERDVYEAQLGDALENRVQRSSQPVSGTSIRQLDNAHFPVAPVSPRLPVNLVVGAVVGLFAAIGLALIRDLMDDHVRSQTELESIVGAPILGAVPLESAGRRRRRSRLLPAGGPGSQAAVEAYRFLGARLTRSARPGLGHHVLFVSPSAGEGCSTTVANTAVMLARGGNRVLVIDANVRNPAQHRIFGVDQSEARLGLSTALVHGDDPAALLHDCRVGTAGSLLLLPAGTCPPDPSSLFDGAGMRRLLDSLTGFDFVLIDGPPVLETTDSVLVAPCVDSVVVVASMRQTKRHDLQRALERLEQFGAPVTGVVANMAGPRDVPASRRAGGGSSPVLPDEVLDHDGDRVTRPSNSGDAVLVGQPVIREGRISSRS